MDWLCPTLMVQQILAMCVSSVMNSNFVASDLTSSYIENSFDAKNAAFLETQFHYIMILLAFPYLRGTSCFL